MTRHIKHRLMCRHGATTAGRSKSKPRPEVDIAQISLSNHCRGSVETPCSSTVG